MRGHHECGEGVFHGAMRPATGIRSWHGPQVEDVRTLDMAPDEACAYTTRPCLSRNLLSPDSVFLAMELPDHMCTPKRATIMPVKEKNRSGSSPENTGGDEEQAGTSAASAHPAAISPRCVSRRYHRAL